MVDMGIIREVTEPTEWCSLLVIVKKSNGNLRLFLDPQNLNKGVVREWYQLPTFKEIAAKMNNASIFSILDGNKGFYQIKLNEESELLTTLSAGNFGRYCYKKMLYGLALRQKCFIVRSRIFLRDYQGSKYILMTSLFGPVVKKNIRGDWKLC